MASTLKPVLSATCPIRREAALINPSIQPGVNSRVKLLGRFPADFQGHDSNRTSRGPSTYAVKQPIRYRVAEHHSTIRLKRLAVWHAVGSSGSQAPLLICSFGAIP